MEIPGLDVTNEAKRTVSFQRFFFTYFFQSSMYLTWEWKDADPVVSCVHVHRKYPVSTVVEEFVHQNGPKPEPKLS